MKLLTHTILLMFLLQTPQEVVLTSTNAHRKMPLKVNELLSKMAQAHVDNMAKQDRYGDPGKSGHVVDGKDFADRLAVSGYLPSIAGENVGACQGQKEPHIEMVKMWMKSEGHRKNIVNEEFTEIGIGVAQSKSGKWYYCQVFGSPSK